MAIAEWSSAAKTFRILASATAYPAVARRSPAVDRDDDVPPVRHPLVDHVTIRLRDHLFVSRSGVNVQDDRVMSAFSKIAWPDNRRIHCAGAIRSRQLNLRQ